MANLDDLGRIMTAEQGKPFAETQRAKWPTAKLRGVVLPKKPNASTARPLPQFDNNRRLMVIR